jgi:hypothetical protein
LDENGATATVELDDAQPSQLNATVECTEKGYTHSVTREAA